MAPIKPYKISVPDSAIERLKAKLALATFPEETEFTEDWEYGTPLKEVKRLVKLWQESFDWRPAEAKLNQLPHFTTTIPVEGHGDLNIHFIHQKSSDPKSIPLLFCHGWPGSFIEVVKLLPLLTEAKDGEPSFHVVAPSLPNFGFSQAPSKRGFGIPQYAEVNHKLMLQLGYDQYVTQGGDWGYIINRMNAVLYPEHVLASHLNYIRGDAPKLATNPVLFIQHALTPYTSGEKAGLERTKWFFAEGFGYNLEQSTKPHTIGFGMADSPALLLAWILEKLHDWTDSYPWTDDKILTWISIYAFSAAGPDAAGRIYYEAMKAAKDLTEKARAGWSDVPLGLSYFPADIRIPPSTWGRTLGPVVYEKRHTEGGHFAAYEKPELLAADLKTMFGKGGGAEKYVKKLTT